MPYHIHIAVKLYIVVSTVENFLIFKSALFFAYLSFCFLGFSVLLLYDTERCAVFILTNDGTSLVSSLLKLLLTVLIICPLSHRGVKSLSPNFISYRFFFSDVICRTTTSYMFNAALLCVLTLTVVGLDWYSYSAVQACNAITLTKNVCCSCTYFVCAPMQLPLVQSGGGASYIENMEISSSLWHAYAAWTNQIVSLNVLLSLQMAQSDWLTYFTYTGLLTTNKFCFTHHAHLYRSTHSTSPIY